eukprot:5066440-Pyramimonas_sp.AAC.1
MTDRALEMAGMRLEDERASKLRRIEEDTASQRYPEGYNCANIGDSYEAFAQGEVAFQSYIDKAHTAMVHVGNDGSDDSCDDPHMAYNSTGTSSATGTATQLAVGSAAATGAPLAQTAVSAAVTPRILDEISTEGAAGNYDTTASSSRPGQVEAQVGCALAPS